MPIENNSLAKDEVIQFSKVEIIYFFQIIMRGKACVSVTGNKKL
jgi:hypothetical protein